MNPKHFDGNDVLEWCESLYEAHNARQKELFAADLIVVSRSGFYAMANMLIETMKKLRMLENATKESAPPIDTQS